MINVQEISRKYNKKQENGTIKNHDNDNQILEMIRNGKCGKCLKKKGKKNDY